MCEWAQTSNDVEKELIDIPEIAYLTTHTHTEAQEDGIFFSLSNLSAVLSLRGSMVPPAGQPAYGSASP